jgi:hypothetical protein
MEFVHLPRHENDAGEFATIAFTVCIYVGLAKAI